jgi:hypothetical protein
VQTRGNFRAFKALISIKKPKILRGTNFNFLNFTVSPNV